MSIIGSQFWLQAVELAMGRNSSLRKSRVPALRGLAGKFMGMVRAC